MNLLFLTRSLSTHTHAHTHAHMHIHAHTSYPLPRATAMRKPPWPRRAPPLGRAQRHRMIAFKGKCAARVSLFQQPMAVRRNT